METHVTGWEESLLYLPLESSSPRQLRSFLDPPFCQVFCKALTHGLQENLRLVLQVHTDHCMSNRGFSEVLAGWWGQGAQKLPPQASHCQGLLAMPTGGFCSHLGREAPYLSLPHHFEVGRLVFLFLLETALTGVDETPHVLDAKTK